MADGAPRTRKNLAERVAGELRTWLSSGDVRAGDRLPTEHELVRRYGVSRTVVREALAGLRADGLVVARQGSGVFVAEPALAQPTLSLLNVKPETLAAIIETLELRAAVESEGAALAAERRSPAELANIKARQRAMAAALEAGEQAEGQDYAFHLAIAESTHNQHFVEFFAFLGARAIPRAQAGGRSRNYLAKIRDEHAVIVDAIAAGDAMGAHDAMRAHLKESQERYEQRM